jgi:hypothetical protein
VTLCALWGFLRGLVAQVFVALGLIGGLWAAAAVFHWLGQHWATASPRLVFTIMQWLVAGLAGMVVASLLQLWGEFLSDAVRKTPMKTPDRLLGILVGTGFGSIIMTLAILVALTLTWPAGLHRAVAGSSVAPWAMDGGKRVCRLAGEAFPGSRWLERRFERAGELTRRRATSAVVRDTGRTGLGRAFPSAA